MKPRDTAARNSRLRDAASDGVVAAAHDAVRALAARSHANVSATTVRLWPGDDGAVARPRRPAVARVGLTMDGRRLQVQAAAPTPREAVGLAIGRLRELMSALGKHDGHGGRRGPRTGSDHKRPAGRRIVHRQWCHLAAQTPDEAAESLETGDEQFHLFIDAESGTDSVIYRGVPNGYLLAQVEPQPTVRGQPRVLTVTTIPAPRMTLPQARSELAALESPFLFFTDEATGRGNVLCRRGDGDYRLVLPAA